MVDAHRTPERPVVAAIGEALFDCFPERALLGGAPLNFIVQIQQLLAPRKGQGVLVSRVGDDVLGRQLAGELENRGVPVHLLQRDQRYPTGQVHVSISPGGDPQYEIVEQVAWDYLAFDDSLEHLAANCDAICFGTLAQRHPVSRETIHRFLSLAPQALRVLDVNLRQEYYSATVLERSLKAANVVKLNEAELLRIGELMPERLGKSGSVDSLARQTVETYDLRILAVTRGVRGTVLYSGDDRVELPPTAASASVDADAVGAGDACSAGLVYGLLMQWPLERTLELANRMGAYVASRPGGTPTLPEALIAFAAA